MKKQFFVLLGILFCLGACQQVEEIYNVDGIEYNAEFALPLVDSKVSMGDLLDRFEENSVLIVDPDGLIRFKYSGDVLSKTSEDVFEAINETLNALPEIPILFNPQQLPFTQPDGLEIDRLEVKRGDIYFGVFNDLDIPVEFTLFVPEATLNGEMLRITVELQPQEQVDFTENPFSFAEYLLVPTSGFVNVGYELKTLDGQPTAFNSSFPFVGFDNLEFSYAEGYLGRTEYVGGRDTIEIDFFDNWIRGDVYFEDPIITFNFENSFGIPTRSIVNVFDIFTVRDEVLPLESIWLEDGIDFPFPELNEVGAIKSKAFVFDKNNSNIDEVLGAGPVAIDYDVNADTNPEEDTSIRGFITDSSYYRVQVDVELPMHGNAVDFFTTDTVEVSLGAFEEVDFAEFKLVTDNGLPLNVDVQGYFLSEDGGVLDSMLDNQQRIIVGAPVDASGNVTEAVQYETFAFFKGDRFEKLKQATNILLNVAFSTTTDGNQSVRVTSDQDVRVRIGLKVGVSND